MEYSASKKKPHPSHKMDKWYTDIRCPADTPRFYMVRMCKACGLEEIKHPAGHFLEDGIERQCEDLLGE